jgi:hypothetical protein
VSGDLRALREGRIGAVVGFGEAAALKGAATKSDSNPGTLARDYPRPHAQLRRVGHPALREAGVSLSSV